MARAASVVTMLVEGRVRWCGLRCSTSTVRRVSIDPTRGFLALEVVELRVLISSRWAGISRGESKAGRWCNIDSALFYGLLLG